MVYLQGAARPEGPSGRCLELFEQDGIELFVSRDILLEINGVLRRPKLQRKFPALTEGLITGFSEDLRSRASFVLEVPRADGYCRDPKDEPYLALAVASGARYLVSFDADLLDLMDAPDFRRAFPNLVILDPPAFLRLFSLER